MVQIIMIVVGLILSGLTYLAVSPSVSASGEGVKTSVLNGELETVMSTATMWLSNKSTDGTFNGITAEALKDGLPKLTESGTGASSVFQSKILSTITYKVEAATLLSTNDSVKVTITGLSGVTNAETNLKALLIKKYGTATTQTGVSTDAGVYDSSATDGTLIVTTRG